MIVQQVPGRLVRDPSTKEPLPATPVHVPRNAFWNRRIAKGDVVLVADKPRELKEHGQ